MTDLSPERYWTVGSERQVESMEDYAEMGQQEQEFDEFGEIMEGYHDFVDYGRRGSKRWRTDQELASRRP